MNYRWIQPLTSILVALIGAVSPIIVSYIQRPEKAKPDRLVLPKGVNLEQRSRRLINWTVFFILLGGAAGGLIGYFAGGALKNVASPHILAPTASGTADLSLIETQKTETDTASRILNTPIPQELTVSPAQARTPTAKDAAGRTPSSLPATEILLTPSPATFRITTRDGTEFKLSTLIVGVKAYQEMVGSRIWTSQWYSTGIPLASGEEIDLDYIQQVDIDPGGESVMVTLRDGSQLSGKLGLDRYPDLRLYGEVAAASLTRPFGDITSIYVQHTNPLTTLPDDLPAGLHAIVYDLEGRAVEIFLPRLEYFIGGYTLSAFGQCEVVKFYEAPTVEGLRLSFSKMREIEFLHQTGVLNPQAVKVTAQDEQIGEYQLAPTYPTGDYGLSGEPCWGGWRITGYIPLGRYSLLASRVNRIIFNPTAQ